MKKKVLTMALLAGIMQVAYAQILDSTEAVPAKLFFSYGPSGSFVKTGSTRSVFGGGSVLAVGWYFNKDFAVYVASKGFHMQRATFRDGDPNTYFRWGINAIGARYSVARLHRTHFYVDGAYLQSSLRPDGPEKLIFSGNGFSTGFGVQHFVAPEWSISADVMYVYSHFRKQVENKQTSDFNMNGHGMNISVRFAWHPLANQKTV